MDKKPKESVLPVAVAGGAMLVCCLGSILLVSGASGFAAWLGGITPLLAAGIAVAIGGVIILILRARKTAATKTEHVRTAELKGDQ